MKLSITQIALGILIILAACYVTGWMIHKAPEYFNQFHAYLIELQKLEINTTYHAMNETLFNLARIGSYLLPVLGLILVSIGIALLSNKSLNRLKLSLTSGIAGLFMIGVLVVIVEWGYITEPIIFLPPDITQETFDQLCSSIKNQDYAPSTIIRITGTMFLLATAVIIVAIAQLVKSRKKAII